MKARSASVSPAAARSARLLPIFLATAVVPTYIRWGLDEIS
jgi:hypothetical protein